MKRALISLLALLFLPPAAAAQFTQVQGTVVDPHGIPYANGTIFPTLVISGSPRFTSSGFPYVPPSQATALDARGAFVMSIADVTQLTPSGGLWTFTVNCAVGCIPPAGGFGPVTFTTVGLIISGTVQDISAVLDAAAPPLTGGGGGGGGVTSINGASGALTLSNVNCAGSTCAQSNPVTVPIGSATLPSLTGTGNTGFGSQFSATCCPNSGVASMWVTGANTSAASWQPIPWISVNGLGPANVSNQNFIGPGASNPPTPPANGINVTWARTAPTGAALAQQQISAAIVGDGVATDCFIGTGSFSPCPGGGGGVTSINGTPGAFTFTGAGVSCATTTCTFTGVGSGISGSGTAPFVPVFTGATSLGNSLITATPNQVVIGSTPLPANPGVQINVSGTSTTNCIGNNTIPLGVLSNIGCVGEKLQYQNQASTSAGVNVGLFVNSNAASTTSGTLGIGIYGATSAVAAMSETRAGYFEANENNGPTVTTRRGLMGVAVNTGGNTTALNEGLVAQTGATFAGGINTNDYTMHCLAPLSGSGVLTTHACLKIDPQLQGVEMQLGAHVFANLPACNATYEGSLAAITDSTVTSGTITGGGTNHVLANCNGSAWVVAAGGGGGSGTVGTGTVGQFAIYNGANSVVGSAALTNNGTSTAITQPLTGTNTPIVTPGFGFDANGAACDVIAGTTCRRLQQPAFVNGSQFGTASATAFVGTTASPCGGLSVPANGTCVVWIAGAINTGQVAAAIVGNGNAANCLSGTGTYVPCSGGTGTAPPIELGTCPGSGTATGGNCTITFSPAFTNTPICEITPVESTQTVTGHSIASTISNVAFTILWQPTGSPVSFHWVCFGNPN